MRAYKEHRSNYPDGEWVDPVRALNATVPHATDHPADDRPEYMDLSKPYVLAVDTETNGFDWFDGKRPFIATASDHDRDYLFTFDNHHDPGLEAGMEREAFREALLAADLLVFHNAKFDLHHIVADGILTLDEALTLPVVDTETLARVVVPYLEVPNFRLKELATIFVDEAAKDSENAVRECMVSLGLIQKATQQRVEAEDAYYQVWCAYQKVLETYALKDTRYTYDLWHVLEPRLDTYDVRHLFDMETTLSMVLFEMEHNGTPLDQTQVRALNEKYTDLAARYQARLTDLNGGEPMNPDSPKDVRAIMEANGVTLTETTKSGEIAVNKYALERATKRIPEARPIVEAIEDARGAAKLLSTYVGPMLGREYVHMDFQQMGARTGRMSCRRPNMQNLPVRSGPEMRSMFVPEPGHSLIVADYSSIELRLLAYYMNHDELWDIIENGDPFIWLGTSIYGTPEQDAWPVKRGPLKNSFYAMTYGAGGPKVAATIGGGMTDAEGKALVQKIKATLGPKYKALNDLIGAKIRKQGYINTLLGRRQYVPKDKTYVGLNALIQGSAADIMKEAMIRWRGTQQVGRTLLTVHDELVAMVPTDLAADSLETMKSVMQSAQDLGKDDRLRLKVEGTICHNSYAEGK